MRILNRKVKTNCELERELLKERLKEYKSKRAMNVLALCLMTVSIAICAATIKDIAVGDESVQCKSLCFKNESERLSELGYDNPKRNGNQVFVVDYKSSFNTHSAEVFAEKVETIIPLVSKGSFVVIDITSGGGETRSCAHSYDQVARLKATGVKVIATIDYLAASCGYELASAADFVFAASGADVGAIGVVMKLKTSGSGANGVIASTRSKRVWATGIITDEKDKEIVKASLLKAYADFVDRVESSRGDRVVDKKAAYSGDVFSGNEAKLIGLIDKVSDNRSVVTNMNRSGFEVIKVMTIEETYGDGIVARLMKMKF